MLYLREILAGHNYVVIVVLCFLPTWRFPT